MNKTQIVAALVALLFLHAASTGSLLGIVLFLAATYVAITGDLHFTWLRNKIAELKERINNQH